MRNCQPAASPVRSSNPLKYLSRAFMFRFQLIPPPTNTPLLPCHVNPNVALSGEFNSVTSGGAVPSAASTGVTIGLSIVTESLRYRSPCSSAVNRRLLRDGTPTPKPYRSPLARSIPSGSPREVKPAYPQHSTRP